RWHPRAGLRPAPLDPAAEQRRLSLVERRPAAGGASADADARLRVQARNGCVPRRVRSRCRRLVDARDPRARPRLGRAGNHVTSLVANARVAWYSIISGANDYW